MSSLFLLLSQSVYAAEIIGNLTGTYDSYGISASFTGRAAVSFQMGAQAHTLGDVKIVLVNFPSTPSSTEANAETFVELRAESGTTPATPDSVVIATLSPNPLTGTAYSSTPTVATFTPASAITLQANTKYWIVARGSSATDKLEWVMNNPDSAPANGTGTYLSHKYSNDSGASWNPSGTKPAIQINGTSTTASPPVSVPSGLNLNDHVEIFATEIEQ